MAEAVHGAGTQLWWKHNAEVSIRINYSHSGSFDFVLSGVGALIEEGVASAEKNPKPFWSSFDRRKWFCEASRFVGLLLIGENHGAAASVRRNPVIRGSNDDLV
ncbi:hypothetical protein U1Q18_018481 [Sarracenia purpurea var. burkii]